MARTTATNDEQRRQKHDVILRAALELFADNGYASTKIAEVASAAGVSFGSVFSYFPSKEELYRQALLEPLARMKAVFLDVQDLGDSVASVQAMIRTHMEFIARNTAFIRIAQQVIAQRAIFPEMFEELNAFHQALKLCLRPVIAQGQKTGAFAPVDPDLVATAYLSFLVGLRLAHPDAPEDAMWAEMGQMAYRLFGPR